MSKTDEEYTCNIELVLEHLQAHGLVASSEKCSFYQEEVVFLCFVITTAGLTMDPAKLDTITSWPYPVNTRQLNSFWGFTNFYCRFIQKFSDLAAPLQALTWDRVDFVKGLASPECSSSFLFLLQAFSTAPFLLHFDFSKKRVLQVECSGFALSAILSQPDDTGAL